MAMFGCAATPEIDSSEVSPDDDDDEEVSDTGPYDVPDDPGPIAICINEFMPANDSVWIEDDGGTPDWVELHNPTATEISLSGWQLAEGADDPTVSPLSGVIEGGGFRFFLADESDGDDRLAFRLSSDGGVLGLFAPDGRGQRIAFGAVEEDFSIARRSDCCVDADCLEHVFRGTPGYGNEDFGPPGEIVLPRASSWRIFQGISPSDGAWVQPDYDDSDWLAGPAPVGYGESDLGTELDVDVDGSRRLTSYVRARFPLDSIADVSSAYILLRADDGARGFINGVEVFRHNLPAGTIDANTMAESVVGGSAEQDWTMMDVATASMREGDNVVAVEIHQATPTSEDLAFDMEMAVRR